MDQIGERLLVPESDIQLDALSGRGITGKVPFVVSLQQWISKLVSLMMNHGLDLLDVSHFEAHLIHCGTRLERECQCSR